MCLVLLYLGDEDRGDAHQVILAANRDEFYSRPTSPSTYYFNPSSAFRKSFETKPPALHSHQQKQKNLSSLGILKEKSDSEPFVVLGPRDNKCGDDGRPLLGSPFLVGSGKRWAVITNAMGSWGDMPSQSSLQMDFVQAFIRLNLWAKIALGMILTLMTMVCHYFRIDQCHYGAFCVISLYSIFLITTWIMKKTVLSRMGYNGLKARGQLLASFVNSDLSPEEFVDRFEHTPDMIFFGFNLIVGVGNNAYFISNRPQTAELIQKGEHHLYKQKLEKRNIYCVSNAFLNDRRGKVQYARSLFGPIVRKLGCQFSNTDDHVITPEIRNKAAEELFQSVMQNTNKCKIIPTFHERKIDYMCAQIFVVPFEITNPETRKTDICGTRDTIVMMMTFDEAYSDEQAGLEGVYVWDVDYCSDSNPSGKMLVFNENTHKDVVTHRKKLRGSRMGRQRDTDLGSFRTLLL